MSPTKSTRAYNDPGCIWGRSAVSESHDFRFFSIEVHFNGQNEGRKRRVFFDMSESDDEPVGIVGSLESLLKDLKDTQVRVTKLLAAERRARRDDTSVKATLLRLRKKVVSVREGLDEVALQHVPSVVRAAKKEEVKKRGRTEAVADEDGGHEESGE